MTALRTVEVERVIAAPVAEVFGFLTDSANYRTVPGVLRARLVTPGAPEPQGAGAVRQVVTAALALTELVTRYEPPHRMEYRIVRAVPPLRHEAGSITCAEVPGGTLVRWRSEFAVATPVAAGLLTRVWTPVVRSGFELVLRTAERRLRR